MMKNIDGYAGLTFFLLLFAFEEVFFLVLSFPVLLPFSFVGSVPRAFDFHVLPIFNATASFRF